MLTRNAALLLATHIAGSSADLPRWHDVRTKGFADSNANKYTQQHRG